MNKLQRAAVLVGVIVALFAVGRMLTPFSTRVVLNPQALRAVSRSEPCGIAMSEATKAPSVRTDTVQLTALGQRQKELASHHEFSSSVSMSDVDLGAVNAMDALYDHATLTTFTLSPCESAARRRVTSAGVLLGLAVAGTLIGFVLLRDVHREEVTI